jgi:hypothetical protein
MGLFQNHFRGTTHQTMTTNVKTARTAKGQTNAAPAPKAAQKFKVMLGNNCKRYVEANAAGGKLYEAGIEYGVTAAERTHLFSLRDDEGVRMFYDAEIIKEQMRARAKKQRKQLAASGDEDARLAIEQEELDTGAVALRNSEGESVGVRGEEGIDA